MAIFLKCCTWEPELHGVFILKEIQKFAGVHKYVNFTLIVEGEQK